MTTDSEIVDAMAREIKNYQAGIAWGNEGSILRAAEAATAAATPMIEARRDEKMLPLLREVVDQTWGRAMEDQSVPSTKISTETIKAAAAKLGLTIPGMED